MRTVYLAPSDLKYVLDECPRCWWLKTRGIQTLREPMPNVFREMDKSMKASIGVDEVKAFGIPAVHEIPFGRIARTLEFPEHGVKIQIRGYLDKAFELEDETLAVIDFKVSFSEKADLTTYARQLHCYVSCIEDPINIAREVTNICLIVFAPSGKFRIDRRQDNVVFAAQTGILHHYPLELDRVTFYEQIEAIAKLAGGELPGPGHGCVRCHSVNEVTTYLEAHDRGKAAVA